VERAPLCSNHPDREIGGLAEVAAATISRCALPDEMKSDYIALVRERGQILTT
jgi:hypothetical protein